MAQVSDERDLSDPFPVTNGVKQDCVLAPTLVSCLFAVMLVLLLHTFRDLDTGVHIHFRTDGKLFNPCRLQTKTKVPKTFIRSFCLLMIVHLLVIRMMTSKPPWTTLPRLASCLDSPSASKRLKSCTNQPLVSPMCHPLSLLMATPSQQWTNAPIWEVLHPHWRWDRLIPSLRKYILWKALGKTLGRKKHHYANKSSGIQSSCHFLFFVCLRILDHIQPPHQEVEPLPPKLSQKDHAHTMARQDARHWGTKARQLIQHWKYSSKGSAEMVQPPGQEVWSQNPQEAALLWAEIWHVHSGWTIQAM